MTHAFRARFWTIYWGVTSGERLALNPFFLAGKGGPHEDGLGALLLSAHRLRDAKSPGRNWDPEAMGAMVVVRCQVLVQFPTFIELPAVESSWIPQKRVNFAIVKCHNARAFNPTFWDESLPALRVLRWCWRSGISKLRSLSGQIFVWRVILPLDIFKPARRYFMVKKGGEATRSLRILLVNPGNIPSGKLT